jgi:hypothetical protein
MVESDYVSRWPREGTLVPLFDVNLFMVSCFGQRSGPRSAIRGEGYPVTSERTEAHGRTASVVIGNGERRQQTCQQNNASKSIERRGKR